MKRGKTMNSEQIKTEKKQLISIIDRSKIEINSLIKIDTLNELEYVVETNFGTLIITGQNLEMQNLDMDKGILWIKGSIDKVDFEKSTKKEESFFKKIFK